MQSILSIQSHVVYGYVGNKAATYPLQALGYDVWPINTVQFSNHTGYKKWQGEIVSAHHIKNLAQGIIDIGQADKCLAILSGYMGSKDICEAVQSIVDNYKAINPKIIYLCDPVIGNNNCYVKPEVLDFFKNNLQADIITPNHYEAEVLSGIKITDYSSLFKIADFFIKLNIKIIVITGIFLEDNKNNLYTFVSDGKNNYIIENKSYNFDWPINGTGDLLSALYLGYYLKSRDMPNALQNAMFYMQQVLDKTYASRAKELQVTAAKYEDITEDQLPHLVKITPHL
jgi:pyridoxine kinase